MRIWQIFLWSFAIVATVTFLALSNVVNVTLQALRLGLIYSDPSPENGCALRRPVEACGTGVRSVRQLGEVEVEVGPMMWRLSLMAWHPGAGPHTGPITS